MFPNEMLLKQRKGVRQEKILHALGAVGSELGVEDLAVVVRALFLNVITRNLCNSWPSSLTILACFLFNSTRFLTKFDVPAEISTCQ